MSEPFMAPARRTGTHCLRQRRRPHSRRSTVSKGKPVNRHVTSHPGARRKTAAACVIWRYGRNVFAPVLKSSRRRHLPFSMSALVNEVRRVTLRWPQPPAETRC
jgi:hypothetical protein